MIQGGSKSVAAWSGSWRPPHPTVKGLIIMWHVFSIQIFFESICYSYPFVLNFLFIYTYTYLLFLWGELPTSYRNLYSFSIKVIGLQCHKINILILYTFYLCSKYIHWVTIVVIMVIMVYFEQNWQTNLRLVSICIF